MEILKIISEIFHLSLVKTESVNFTLGALISLIFAFIVTSYLLRIIRRFVTRKLPDDDKNKFISIFQFIQYIVYIYVFMFTLDTAGVDIKVLLTASAAIFLGLGFALQQLFQDLISGVFIILDQSLRVGDIIEVEGKTCRVEKISLRSTRALTLNNRVMVIPNHKFLSDILFNWTQNSNDVREKVSVGVAYGSDTKLVESVLLKVVNQNPVILKTPKPVVLFENFGDSSLDFSVYFYTDDAFSSPKLLSDLRFKIDEEFRKNKITIPFPQRDVHLFESKS
jgi:small-conductance mechanosensitive channel